MSRDILFYLHVHQPFRVKKYSIFDAAVDHEYFNDTSINADTNNRYIIDKVSEKSYLPANKKLLEILTKHPEFRLSMSISGVLLEQLKLWRPDVLQTFKDLVDTGNVELLGETYHHSLAFFHSKPEFEIQVQMHRQIIKDIFGQSPKVFRNTELSYNNDLALWADKAGYDAIITEGWDPVLGWRSPNYLYKPVNTENIKLFLKNYKLSDDIAFRFSNKDWEGWPLTAEKFTNWINQIDEQEPLVNLFMDYETFGEHQWGDTGIFNFLEHLPVEFLKYEKNGFTTFSEALKIHKPMDEIDVQNTITWADTERDLSAWLGNKMQQDAIKNLYDLEERIISTNDWSLIEDWRKLQTSDHFYYMCTKWFSDGDVHAYFSPYESPYVAFMSYMNVIRDLELRLKIIEGANL